MKKRKRNKMRNDKMRYVNLVGQPEKRWYHTNKRKIETASFFVVLGIGFVVSLLIPLRPTFSESEKRELAEFPEFSVETLIEGEYFAQIDTWFADTFPFREFLTNANSMLTSWYGFGDKVSSLGNVVADEIPDVPATTEPESTTQPPVTDEPSTQGAEENTSETAEITDPPTSLSPTEPSTEGTTAPPKKTQSLGGILVVGNKAYEYYNFSQTAADLYVKSINRTANALKGTGVQVYDMIVPTSIDVTLDESTRKSVQSSDQQKAINYMYGSMDSSIKKVDILPVLRSHANEYIYFRTDHHWTALGAYYAYAELMKAKGVAPLELKADFTEKSYGDFLGSFYTDTNKNKKLEKKPDELIAYVPNFKTEMYYYEADGDKIIWPLVYDVSSYPVGYKYSTFAGGDNKYTRVHNQAEGAKGSCIVVKESFGNAMIPFIAGNYKYVYVIDYRYWEGSLSELAEAKGAEDIIFINNVSATRNVSLMDTLNKICK